MCDGANYVGPEVYEYTKKHTKHFGFAGAKNHLDERVRYQVGMMLIASGARNFQYWHLTVKGLLMQRVGNKLLRSISMVAKGEGLDDLKIHRLLTDAIKQTEKDPKKKNIVKKAKQYLENLHSVWDADHIHAESYPYLGLATDWGYDQFYQDWQKQMGQYAAQLLDIQWID